MRIILIPILIIGILGMIISLLENNIVIFLICFFLLPLLVMINHVDSNRLLYTKKINSAYDGRLSVKNFDYSKKEKIVKCMVEIPLLRNIYDFSVKNHANNYDSTAILSSSESMGRNTVKIVVISFFVSIVLSVGAYFLFENIQSFLLLLCPVLVFFYKTKLSTRESIDNRKKSVESELLFFAIFCDVIDTTQSNIQKSFEKLLEIPENIFPAMRNEGNYIKREIMLFGMSINTVIEKISQNHPSKIFSRFVLGYLTNSDLGGRATGNYFENTIKNLSITKQQELENYSNTTSNIAPMGIFMLSFVPMILMIISVFESGSLVFFIMILCLIFIPMVMSIVILKIGQMAPLPGDIIPTRKIPIILGVITLLITLSLGLHSWELVAFPAIVWSLYNWMISKKLLSENKDFDISLPRFINDVNQNMLTSSFHNSFKNLTEKQNYDKVFNVFLKNVKNRLDLGENIEKILPTIKTNSWLSTLSLQLISFSAKTGNVNHTTLTKLSSLLEKWIEIKEKMASGSAMALLLAYLGSFIGIMMVILLPLITTQPQIDSFTSFSNVKIDNTIDDAIISMNYTLLFIIAFFGMTMVSKIKSMTIHDSLHTGIIMILLSVVIYANEYLDFSNILF